MKLPFTPAVQSFGSVLQVDDKLWPDSARRVCAIPVINYVIESEHML